MSEEEAGFTFVDKRRAKAEAPAAAEAVEAVLEPDTETAEANGTSEAPSIYDLIGYCISLLSSQAWQKLGLLANPQTGEAKPDLLEAKIAIDTVGDLAVRLEAAPESAISTEMRRDLRTLLNDLRLNYVSQCGPSA
jgi:hypothetical protein